jgi:two-component system, chemotaxis family, CheB/CheR fusion protein
MAKAKPAPARKGGARKRVPKGESPKRRTTSTKGSRRRPERTAASVDHRTEVDTSGRLPFPVVGIGMSAGGFEACCQLLQALPQHPGFAVVVVQHLSPHHPSALPQLMSGRAAVRFVEARDGTPVESNRVHVIPPEVYPQLVDGRLLMVPRPDQPGVPTPIDSFFVSLAMAQGERAIVVILSGMGSDGAQGVRAVKARGGFVFVQAPETAKYDGMPRAAIETGAADLVLPPAGLAQKLVELAGDPNVATGPDTLDPFAAEPARLNELFDMLRAVSGVDFSHYKSPTIKRRVLRRMALNRVADLPAYVDMLRSRPDEVRDLYSDILIHVTRFFREPESFEALSDKVLSRLIVKSRADNPIRIWVAGCATGEEVYSLVMTLLEHAGDRASGLNLQVFGTDVSEVAIQQARLGIYPATIAGDVSSERLRRFFTKVDSGYRISKSIRDYCVFARQDLTRDPPFSKLDLILCRNVLIYMDSTLQRKLIPTFHYALKPNGFLMLGQAETTGMRAELFALVDKEHKIYRKKQADRVEPAPPLGIPYVIPPMARAQAQMAEELQGAGRVVQKEATRILLDRYGPPGILVNEDLDILEFRGHTGKFLEPSPGDASLNLLKLARQGLLHSLRSGLQVARKNRKPVRKEGVRVRSNGGWIEVDLEIIPIVRLSALHFLVLFEEKEAHRGVVRRDSPGARPVSGRDGREKKSRIEQELEATREYLQSIIQEMEATNEELQSANEEILSSNEELQSANEELDTAKEELQSTNEELNTLNDELHARNEELTRVNSDLMNLLATVPVALVIVTADLGIRHFTPMAERLFNLIRADLGRPITQLRPRFDCPWLGDIISEVIDRVKPFDREVQDEDGRWYTLGIRPYKGLENRIEGAVVTVVDIDAAKRHEMELTEAREYAEAIVEAARQPLVVMDESLEVRLVNRAFVEWSRLPREEVEGRQLHELPEGPWCTRHLREKLQDAVVQRRPVEGVAVNDARHDGQPVSVVVNLRPIDGRRGRQRLIVAGFETVEGE